MFHLIIILFYEALKEKRDDEFNFEFYFVRLA